ncbi:phage tail tape measure protein [Streptomyces sp. NBC_01298]|uniref:phage tail tape measure protein n=1 Tax=Streptomyces sp. NBC_01298 TaxID=2903817 RepID=UPI002E0F6C5C|nr:phage tail tape measure protein [Streptomyces sp. NBC_01298]
MAVEVGMGYVSIVPEIEGFAGELDRAVTGPAESAGQEAGQTAGEGFTGKMGGILKGGLAAVGIAAAAVLAKGFMDALDQTAINGKIQAQLGSTPAEAARYGKAAGQLYAHGVGESVAEAADAISGVMRAGILPPDATNAQIEAITGKVKNLSDTFELDLGQTSNAVGQMLKNGLAKDGAEALDILTAGMQKMGPRADDMADTFNEYSTKFRDLGLSAADAMGLMSQGMLAGARDTDTVADALKEFQIRATDGSKASTDAYVAIGLNAAEMTKKIARGGPEAKAGLQQVLDGLKAIKDPAERSAASVGLFGTKSEDLGQALYALDPKTAVKAMGDTAGAADKMADALHNNASAKIEQFKRTAEVAVTNFIGDKVLPPLISFASTAKDVLGPALGTARDVVGGFLSAFSSGAGGSSIAGFGQTLLGLGTTIRDAVSPSVSALVTQFQTSVLPALQGVWSVVSGQVIPAFMAFYSALYSSLAPIVTRIVLIFTETVIPALMRIYATVYEKVQPVLAALSEFITSRVVPAVQMIGGKLQELFDKAQPVISVVVTVIEWLAKLAASILSVVIPVILQLAGPIFSGLFSAIGTAIGWIGNVIGWLGSLGQAFVGAVRWVADFGRNAIAKLDEFARWMDGLGPRIRDGLGDFGNYLVGKGADLVRGLWSGVQSMGAWLRDKLIGWARNTIPGPIADALGIHSPSRLMRDEIGRWLPAGIAEGIDDEQASLDARLQAMVKVPDIGSVRAAGPVRLANESSAKDKALAAVLRALEADQGREIVVKVGEQEIARAVEYGQRQLARR